MPFKELKNLTLSLRRGPWWFEVDWVAWTEWSWHESVWGHWLEQEASSSNWTRKYEDACLLSGNSEEEKEIFVAPRFSDCFLQIILEDSCIATSTVGLGTWWSRWTAYSSSGSSRSFNCLLFVCHIFCRSFTRANISGPNQNTQCETTIPVLTFPSW